MKQQSLTIGILSLQGAFLEHAAIIQKLQDSTDFKHIDIKIVFVNCSADFNNLSGIIVPGGESTTMWKFIIENSIEEDLTKWMKDQKPIWGTCAGLILLSASCQFKGRKGFGMLDIEVARNFYGRQIDSFEADVQLLNDDLISNGNALYHAIFIRAPAITSLNDKCVSILATKGDQEAVAVRQENMLATSFHPELTSDSRWHQYFLTHMVLPHQLSQ